VGLRVKGALVGRMHRQERAPAHMRLNAQAPPPLKLTLCFSERTEARQFVSTMMAYRKYYLSVTLSTYIHAHAAASRRELARHPRRIAEDSTMAVRMNEHVPSVEPPPLPPRPPELPPTNRLPRMVSNDEGEVFWYVPKPKPQHPDSISSTGACATLQPKGARMSLTPLPQPAGAGDDDVAFPSPESDAPRSVGAKPAAATAGAAATAAHAATPAMPGSNLAATMEDDVDMSLVETPAPCLKARTPDPGWKH